MLSASPRDFIDGLAKLGRLGRTYFNPGADHIHIPEDLSLVKASPLINAFRRSKLLESVRERQGTASQVCGKISRNCYSEWSEESASCKSPIKSRFLRLRRENSSYWLSARWPLLPFARRPCAMWNQGRRLSRIWRWHRSSLRDPFHTRYRLR